MDESRRTAQAHLDQALALITEALRLWQVDPDEDTSSENALWADLLDFGNDLAKRMKVPGPDA